MEYVLTIADCTTNKFTDNFSKILYADKLGSAYILSNIHNFTTSNYGCDAHIFEILSPIPSGLSISASLKNWSGV